MGLLGDLLGGMANEYEKTLDQGFEQAKKSGNYSDEQLAEGKRKIDAIKKQRQDIENKFNNNR